LWVNEPDERPTFAEALARLQPLFDEIGEDREGADTMMPLVSGRTVDTGPVPAPGDAATAIISTSVLSAPGSVYNDTNVSDKTMFVVSRAGSSPSSSGGGSGAWSKPSRPAVDALGRIASSAATDLVQHGALARSDELTAWWQRAFRGDVAITITGGDMPAAWQFALRLEFLASIDHLLFGAAGRWATKVRRRYKPASEVPPP